MRGRMPVGMLAMLAATMNVRPDGAVEAPPLAKDEKLKRRERTTRYASCPAEEVRAFDGIPFPNLHHVSRETMNRPDKAVRAASAVDGMLAVLQRVERRARRKARMRLRKRRGWR